MSLRSCNECSKSISSFAASCPNCGLPGDNDSAQRELREAMHLISERLLAVVQLQASMFGFAKTAGYVIAGILAIIAFRLS